MAFGAGGDSSGAGLDCCERVLLDAVLKWPVESVAIDLNERVTFGRRARRRAREKGDGERSGVGEEAMVTRSAWSSQGGNLPPTVGPSLLSFCELFLEDLFSIKRNDTMDYYTSEKSKGK